jgi:hypothetical protein
VHHQNFLVDAMSKGQHTEHFRKAIVHLDIILMLYLTFEPIHFVQILTLMVAARHKEVLRVAAFPRHHGHNDLNRERASVNKISIK